MDPKKMKIRFFYNNIYSRNRARPLTLKEVLRLRDGMETSKNQPYQIQKTANNEKIILALN
jgi:hypothetical protein